MIIQCNFIQGLDALTGRTPKFSEVEDSVARIRVILSCYSLMGCGSG